MNTIILHKPQQPENKTGNQLKHAEFRLKQAQAIAHIGSWELNFSTGIAEWSEEACRIYGLDPNDNVQSYQSWISFIHPDDLEYVLKMIKEGHEKLSNTSYHHRILRKDGSVRYLLSKANFEFDEEGHPVGLYGVAHDVTEAKEAELALAQSEANLRLIVDLLPESIVMKDYNGKFLYVNKTFAALYGFTPDEMLSKSASDLTPDKNEAERFVNQDREVILSGETRIIPEQIFTDRNGNARFFHTVKVPFTTIGTNNSVVLVIAREITEQKNTDTERTKMTGEIIQRNKILEQFTYIVSHNLRAPVANILGMTEVLQAADLDKSDEKEFITALGNAANKLDNIVLDLNEILQVEHRESKLKEPVKFSEILADIESGFDGLIQKEHVKIVRDFSAVNEMQTLKGYIHSIFFNLISNSIKYRQPDIEPAIEISSALVNNKIRIIFKDNGIGINLDKNDDKVFGLYKRFHTHVDGKGMGLFMVKTQVELLGGTISITSEVNKGTEFIIEF